MEEILVKYFSGEASDEEKVKVEEWRGASRENAESFLAYKQTWIMTNPLAAPDQEVLDSILKSDDSENQVNIIPIWSQRSFQVAASVIVVLCAAFYFFKTDISDQPFDKVLTEKTEFDLPDGSSVTVQRGGMLSLVDFEERRELTLTGKAFFEVESDENKPFLINTKGAIVKVLGTSFVVNSPLDDHTTEVMVKSGKVSMGQNPAAFGLNTMEIQLGKGEMGIIKIGERGIKKKKIRDENYLSWQNEIISFKNTKLNQVSELLEDVYGVSIDFKNPALEKCNLTAKFNKKTSDEVISIIAETFALDVKREGDRIVLDGESCK